MGFLHGKHDADTVAIPVLALKPNSRFVHTAKPIIRIDTVITRGIRGRG